MNKEDAKKLWESIQENTVKLKSCAGHCFEPYQWTGTLLRRVKCQNCGGITDKLDLNWYQAGIKHAGGDPQTTQSWPLNEFPKPPGTTT